MVPLSFLRVPEISDDFQLPVYICRATKAEDVISGVSDTLGLAPVIAGASIPYQLEEVIHEKNGKESRYPQSRNRYLPKLIQCWLS